MKHGIVYVNSTLGPWKELYHAGEFSPLHFWGYKPEPDDTVLQIKQDRLSIKLRSYIHGFDFAVAWKTYKSLRRGARAIYLVTTPDLLSGLPFLRKRYPGVPILTWAWTEQNVLKQWRVLSKLEHTFCLTEGAKAVFDARNATDKASFHLWGADPTLFRRKETHPQQFDLNFLGLSRRDVSLVNRLLSCDSYRMLTTARVAQSLDASTSTNPQITVKSLGNFSELCSALHQSSASLIPIHANDNQPSGYTNLVESLLCGTPVITARESLMPRAALTAQGVYLYQAGDLESLRKTVREAVLFGQNQENRKAIAEAASKLFNGESLRQAIQSHLKRNRS